MSFTKNCATPGCKNVVTLLKPITRKEYHFCDVCKRSDTSHKVLVIQAQHGYLIRQILLDAASLFSSVSGMSDYVGVSSITMYSWLDKYFEMSFHEFKRRYICKSKHCYSLDVSAVAASYSRHDYILKKIRRTQYCACATIHEPGIITTNAPPALVSRVLQGSTRIARVSDASFKLMPEAFFFPVTPLFFSVYPVYF